MYTTIKFEGIMNKILEQAVSAGLAKTKSEALRLGVLELNNKYSLLENIEEQKDVEYIKEARKKIKSGELKLYGQKQLDDALSK